MDPLTPPTARELMQARRIARFLVGSFWLGPVLCALAALMWPGLGVLCLSLLVAACAISVLAFVRFKIDFTRRHRQAR